MAETQADGTLAEARLAQLWYWEGFYARRGVDLQRHFKSEPISITDLDLLAFDFNPQLRRTKYIGEVKTGAGKTAASPLDRILWLRGLKEVVSADFAELTTRRTPSAEVRSVADSLGMRAQSLADLERREQEVVGSLSNLGAHGKIGLDHK